MKKLLCVLITMFVLIPLTMVESSSIKNNTKEELNSMESVETIDNVSESGFKGKQVKNERVREAIIDKEDTLKKLFEDRKWSFPPEKIFLRAFKEEEVLELWVKVMGTEKFQFLKNYKFTKSSGVLGPKRKQGDNQIPEGFYYIERFNPQSKFYFSLGINYPNKSDKVLSDKEKPGNDIFIHGGSASVGCIPIGDENIRELYLLAIEAKNNGQNNIPVHIFPTKLDDEGFSDLKDKYSDKQDLISFWENLKVGHDYFENNKVLPQYTVDIKGKYIFSK